MRDPLGVGRVEPFQPIAVSCRGTLGFSCILDEFSVSFIGLGLFGMHHSKSQTIFLEPLTFTFHGCTFELRVVELKIRVSATIRARRSRLESCNSREGGGGEKKGSSDDDEARGESANLYPRNM